LDVLRLTEARSGARVCDPQHLRNVSKPDTHGIKQLKRGPRVEDSPEPARPQKKELTGEAAKINLSASVDETDLIESGRGTGPTTPRQPVEARLQ